MGKNWLISGILSAFFGVVFGAFGGHVLKSALSEKAFSIYLIGVQYQFWHAFALIALGLWSLFHPTVNTQLPGVAFTTGIALFSGSLYALALTDLHFLGIVTPLGGFSFLLGWASFGYLVLKNSTA